MIMDANVFVGESIYDNSLSMDALKQTMRESGVGRAVIRPLKPHDLDLDRANKAIAKIVKSDPSFIGFARINPLMRDAVEQVKRAVEQHGLRGIHLHPWEESFAIDCDKVRRVMEAAGRAKVPVAVSAGFPMLSHPLQIKEVADEFPEVTLLVSHGGQQDNSGLSFDDSLIMAEESRNVIFDVCGVYRRDFIELLAEKAGEDRLVFGSCAPYMDMSFEIVRIESTKLPQALKEKIFHTNIERVLGIGSAADKR